MALRGRGGGRKASFLSSPHAYIGGVGFRAGYGDKLRRTIGAADPGAVPGGSTRWLSCSRGQLTGPNQDRRSEEHTSALQSLMRISYAVFCLKKTTHIT